MTAPTVTVATRVSAEERAAIEWLAKHKDITIAEVLDRYGTHGAVVEMEYEKGVR